MCFAAQADRALEARHLRALAAKIADGRLAPEAAGRSVIPSSMHVDRVWATSETAHCPYLAGIAAARTAMAAKRTPASAAGVVGELAAAVERGELG
jgi:hypothetical protein